MAWRSSAIRQRLTMWYTVVLSLMLIGYAAATYLAVRREFQEEIEGLSRDDLADDHLREVAIVLLVGIPPVVIAAGVGGYVLAGRALAPVEASFEHLRRFTADASHELRTPLAVIRGIGEVGLRETRTAAEYKEAIGSMLEEVDRLTHLVDTLLRLSRGDAGTIRLSREPIDLGQLVSDAVSSLAIVAEERGQRIAVHAPAGLTVSADRLVLRAAITNVLDNAIKYSPDGSTIDARVAANGDGVTVAIADQGPGIAAEHRERIFDRFYRIDEARSRDRGGTGLGLAIARWAVEEHGGRITVESRSMGSVFQIVLPAEVKRNPST